MDGQIQSSSERGRSAQRFAAHMTAFSRCPSLRAAFYVGFLGAAIFAIALIIWQGFTARGTPDPTQPGTSSTVAFMDIGVLVFREGERDWSCGPQGEQAHTRTSGADSSFAVEKALN